MENTRNCWLPAAQSADWFSLTRHDDPEPTDPELAADPVDDPEPEPDPEPDGADKLGDAGKKALDRMKAERAAAKKEAAEAKKRADELARKVADFEDRDKSELEKATTKADRLEAAAAKATARAVKAEVKALAADAFADPTDADLLGDLSRYVDADGEIDTESISADLEALLERKPHLRKPAAETKRQIPKPDPGQGSRTAEPPTDFRTADRDALDAELAKLAPGFRLRS
ncbi:hypothetical protein ACJ6WE_08965 [Streptomyces sp. MMS24-I31]|uniref:hypothetical protein n=1 Tax=Streptomyces sp. MMS24-I31 TaxID=3351563 RepID=UPI003896CFBE